jgi:hypothetical protein
MFDTTSLFNALRHVRVGSFAAGDRGDERVRRALEHEVKRRRRRTRRVRVRFGKAGILVAGVEAAGTLATAAAGVTPFSAATGIHVRASDPNAEAIGTGQAIALGASDDITVGVKLTHDIHFAPGYESWRAGTIAFRRLSEARRPSDTHRSHQALCAGKSQKARYVRGLTTTSRRKPQATLPPRRLPQRRSGPHRADRPSPI